MALRRKIGKTFYIPPRIINELDKSMHSPLTLIEAPSGFGKTVAVQDYLNCHVPGHLEKYWYTCLGESAVAAWDGICTMLSKVDATVARKLSMLGFPNNDSLVKLRINLQEIQCSNETVFVIDNYQLIREDMAPQLLEALAQHNNPSLHFIIVSQPSQRGDVLSLQMSAINFLNSRLFFFDNNDTRQLFLHNGIHLTPEEKETISEMTEGWIAALSMYCMEYKITGTFSKCEGVDELIENTVWNRISEREKELLLYLSIFESFTVRQICVILGQDVLPKYAEHLLKSNIFIRYENNIHGYVMHSLLRDYLLRRIERNTSASEGHRMYETAGIACASEKLYYQAAKFFYMTNDFEQLLKLPLKGKELTNYLGKSSDLFMMKVVENTPIEILYKHPQLLFVFAFELFALGKMEQFSHLCGIIGEILNDESIMESDMRMKLKGEFILLLSFTKFNDISEMSKMQRMAYDLLQGPSKFFVANDAWTFGAPSVLYMFWEKSGYLVQEMEQMEDCNPYYSKLASGHGSGAGEAMRAEAYFLAGDDVASEVFCHKAIYIANQWKQDCIVLCAHLQMARIALLRGDVYAFEKSLEAINYSENNATEQRTQYVGDLCESFLALLRGEADGVTTWLTDYRSISSNLYEIATSYAHIIHLKYLWLKGGIRNSAEILGLAEIYLSVAEKSNFLLPKVYILIFMGLLSQARGAFGEAQKSIDGALAIAMPDKIYMPFAEMGKEIIPLLERALLTQKDLDGVRRILNLTERHMQGIRCINSAIYKNEYKLTPREREISILVQEGMNNQEIADHLFVSIYTVKNTLKKVFTKIGIKKREELRNIKL